MAINYAYHYAEIDPVDNMCIAVQTTTREIDLTEYPEMVEIPVYDEEYICKYYINGAWYEDPEGTIPWTSSLL